MRYVIITTFLFLLNITANSQTIEKELTGKWKLIETKIDPGDGSGQFRKVDSEKMLQIESNGIVKSNGDVCSSSLRIDDQTHGQLRKDSDEITLTSCDNLYKPLYKLKGKYLIVYYSCKEGCAEKYERKK